MVSAGSKMQTMSGMPAGSLQSDRTASTEPVWARLPCCWGGSPTAGMIRSTSLGGPRHLVWSTDHGMPAHFIPIWPHVRREGEWQGFELRAHAAITRALRSDEYASPHEVSEIREPASRLATVSDEQIASAVAAAPDEWRFGLGRRLAFMRYLQRRRGELTFKCLDAPAKRSQRTPERTCSCLGVTLAWPGRVRHWHSTAWRYQTPPSALSRNRSSAGRRSGRGPQPLLNRRCPDQPVNHEQGRDECGEDQDALGQGHEVTA
jgi:hypothetical protein